MYFLHTCYLQIWHWKGEWEQSQKVMLNGIICFINILDFQLLVQSVYITTKVVSSNPDHIEVYLIQHCVIKFVIKTFVHRTIRHIFKWCIFYILAICKYGTLRLGLWRLTLLSTIFQLYRGGQFYWWRKPEYPEKTTDLS
jgi:hypothetical protein